ncbi:hypothetical protein WA1_51865 [Scytonema hofmannii PCC 7110]|uniref:Uncharacterized protein n=1 Tax=Scytonema hofmannii PCC 7110 TaxID=128403 RepID=A0A139XAT7_9CYAN|nr:hypothetical protein [Scytonema hofmannii]KYC41817.1 hypothetical protein WA1_17480 [Scytonema hofmannii PCC 7110]KYC44269.1 hypothetical protein WA1_51865 [Scytonema hofmannii PCC 7110]
MAKITISQLHTVDTGSIQELTNAEIDTTKGGIAGLPLDVFGVSFGSTGFVLDTASKTVFDLEKYVTEDLARKLSLA